ncbi:VanZ family protein [Desulforamulus aeronauticus]|uniref:VanZ like family protein n=1 Tax=Desulforamulus aeronauticus DSM 10349 TaxID=1121421 RepID=A0A1M6WJG2_9FIRM|nr:VanZ family protein [Desulforamulus aeronauticus]SHK93857.1 VanZ like family protein [Desulforamulus aeronauticus DSM 10349]
MYLVRLLGRYTLRLLPLVYMMFIWFLSSQSSGAVVNFSFYDSLIKESLHLVEFAILYGLLVLALLTRGELSRRGNKIAIGISILYALLDEFHQSFIPSRSATVTDLVKDFLGVAVVWYILRRTYFQQEHTWLGFWMRKITHHLAPGKCVIEDNRKGGR